MNQRSIHRVSEKKQWFSLLICVVFALCFCVSIDAQSGRRPKIDKTPSKTSVTKLPVKNSPAASKSREKDDYTNETDVKISSIIIVGNSRDIGSTYYRSTHLSNAIKECIKVLNNHIKKTSSGLIVKKGKKMDFPDTLEMAKKETDSHILWMEIVTTSSVYGRSRFVHIDFALLAPKTTKRLVTARVKLPNNTTIVGNGGVIKAPSTKTTGGSVGRQIRMSAMEVINRLIRWEWI